MAALLGPAVTRIIAVYWVHQYLPVDGSIIGTRIIAVNWVYRYLPGDGSIIGTQSTEKKTLITSTLCTVQIQIK